MDDNELKNTLKKQKMPFDEAVNAKIAYLKSDDVFLDNGDEYISTLKSFRPSSITDEFFKSFNELQNTKVPEAQTNYVQPGIQPSVQQSTQPKMTIADRIAALRGAIHVSPEYRRR